MVPRGARTDELPTLVAAANRVFRTRGGDMGADYPLLFTPENRQRLRVIVRDGAVLSHAGYVLRDAVLHGRAVRVASFGAVFTDQDERGCGLASRCVLDAVAAARAEGAELGAVSGEGRLYARFGFKALPPALRVRVAAARAPELQTTAARPEDVPALVRLHDAEPARLLRSEPQWHRLLAARIALWSRGTVHLVRMTGVTVGYLVTEDQPRAGGDGAWLRAVEVAGNRSVVGRSGAALAAARGAQGLEILSTAHDQALIRTARHEGWSSGEARFPFAAASWGSGLDPTLLPFPGLDYV